MATKTTEPVTTTVALGSVIAVIAGAVLFKIGFAMFHVMPPLGEPAAFAAIVAVYVAAFALIFAGVAAVDLSQWGRPLSLLSLGALFLGFYASYLTNTGGGYLGTDGILFTRYSVDLLLAGENPYAHSMLPAFEQYPIDNRFVTYRVDGSIVSSLSYPALSVLLFIPQALLGIPNLNLTTVAVLLVVLAFLSYESPPQLALVPIIVMFADPNLTFFSYGGVFDILWVLPLLLAMRFWHRNRLDVAAAFVGLAFAVKQTPWFIGPFLAVWLYQESETLAAFRTRAVTCLGYGFGGFLLPNLPFILWDVRAWASSVLTPVASGAALVKQGQGLTLVSVSGLYGLPKTFFTLTLLLALLLALVIYALYFDRLKWAAWIVPAVILWFNYRSLANYFIFFVPVAYYAVLLNYDLVRGRRTEGRTDV